MRGSVVEFGPTMGPAKSLTHERPTGQEKSEGRGENRSEMVGGLVRLRRAWATLAELVAIGINPATMGPDWFVRWETWQGTYYVATQWALEQAGLVVDEADDEVPRYFPRDRRPSVTRLTRERGRVYGLDLEQLNAPEAAVLKDQHGDPVELWGRQIRIDPRLTRTPPPKMKMRKRINARKF